MQVHAQNQASWWIEMLQISTMDCFYNLAVYMLSLQVPGQFVIGLCIVRVRHASIQLTLAGNELKMVAETSSEARGFTRSRICFNSSHVGDPKTWLF